VPEREWDRELSEIVGRTEPERRVAKPGAVYARRRPDDTVDLRAGAPAPSEAWVELRLERVGASLLKLVDQRLSVLTDEVRTQAAMSQVVLQSHALDVETRLDALEDVLEALAMRILDLQATLEAIKRQVEAPPLRRRD
jgi:hypothetical protein